MFLQLELKRRQRQCGEAPKARSLATGFTILEMLLAVTLFTIVMTASYSIFSMGISIWRRSQGASQVERKVYIALERMGVDFRSTIRIDEEDYDGKGKPSECKLPMILTAIDHTEEPIYQYGWKTYKLDKSTKSLCVLEERLHEKSRTKKECRPLVPFVKSLKFEYWLYDGIGDSYDWYDEFDEDDALPQAIKVELELESKLKGETTEVRKIYERTFLIPVGGLVKKDQTETVTVSTVTTSPSGS